MSGPGALPVIGAQDVAALGLTLPDLTAALAEGFAAAAAGRIAWQPKSSIMQPDGAWFISTMGCWPEKKLGIFHSIAGIPATPAKAGPHYHSVQLLTDYATSAPLATLDGSFTSMMLPAGVTLLAARALARPDSAAVAFVGAGVQARINLDALRIAFPVAAVRVISRTQASAESFAAYARARGLAATVHTDPQAALHDAALIVTSVPSGSGPPFLDPAWVAPGGFVSGVDLGRSWRPGFAAFDRIVTDDREQAVAQHRDGRLPHALDYDTDLPELVTGARPSRSGAAERAVVLHPGNLVGVLALTELIHRRWLRASGR